MKLFIIEIFAIALLIVAFAFIFNLYKRFYKYFSKSDDTKQPGTEATEETKVNNPKKAKFTPPVIVINTPDDSKKSEKDNNVNCPDETDSSVIEEEPTKTCILADIESDQNPKDITSRIPPDYKSADGYPDSSPIQKEPKTRIYSPSDAGSPDICSKVYPGKDSSETGASAVLVEPKTRVFTGKVKLSEPPTKRL